MLQGFRQQGRRGAGAQGCRGGTTQYSDCNPRHPEVLQKGVQGFTPVTTAPKGRLELGLRFSAVDCERRTIWIADGHRGDGKRTAFMELEAAICLCEKFS